MTNFNQRLRAHVTARGISSGKLLTTPAALLQEERLATYAMAVKNSHRRQRRQQSAQ